MSSLFTTRSLQANSAFTTRHLKDDSIVKVVSEVADSQEEREYGFMNRKKIPDGTGMIFVFEKDQPLSFWMKNSAFWVCTEGVPSKLTGNPHTNAVADFSFTYHLIFSKSNLKFLRV